ncbi:hypothetical protein KCP69_22710 [Salmonella enterica subsp. enterica]|nr:hypothetical protein KCP69_22710 [Salmonella enterica subsp. enterica]
MVVINCRYYCITQWHSNSALLDPKGQIGLEQRSPLILTAFGLMLIVVIPLMAVGFARKYRAVIRMQYSPNWSHSIKWKLWSGRCLSSRSSFPCRTDWKPRRPGERGAGQICGGQRDWKVDIHPERGIAVARIAFRTRFISKVTSNSVTPSLSASG